MAVSVIVKVGVKLLSTKKGRRFIVGIICAVFMYCLELQQLCGLSVRRISD